MNTKPNSLKTKFTESFNIDYPIISAPMFLVSDTNMVIQTSTHGGLGTFPALNFRPIEKYREAIQDIKSKTDKPFGINIIVQKANKYKDQQLEIALEEKVPLLITSLGNPKEVIKKAHEVGTKVYCDVVGQEHAKKVEDLGADGLIAVSYGAGGHAGDISPMNLIPELKQTSKLPLVAAGGITNGSGMLAALSLGADAVYMGTRFIASKEAPVLDDYKKAIIQSSARDIYNTDRVDGFPGNFIMTESLKKLGVKPNMVESLITQIPKTKRLLSLYRAGKALLGDPNQKASYKNIFSAGHGVGLIDKNLSIEEILHSTMNEYYIAKSNLP